MSTRTSLAIAAAALRWHTAYERRRLAVKEKNLAERAFKEAGSRIGLSSAAQRMLDSGPRVTELKRQERAAMRALAKVCASARNEITGAADATDALPKLASPARASLPLVEVLS